MQPKTFWDSINISKQCHRYGLPLWQCPQFLFLVLGLVVITSSVAIYFIGLGHAEDPEIVVLIVLGLSAFLMIIGFSITQSFERLAEVARMKAEFISVVSHQLRAPLANLRWITDLLISGRVENVPEKQTNYLQILRENGQRMDELVSDLLTVSRIESNEFLFKKEKASLLELTQRTVNRLDSLARASNVEVKLSAEDNLPEAFFDPFQIGQVIENLLDNAIRYIKGRGCVNVVVSQKNNYLHLEVKDDGIGISREDQKYIGQKFFRGSNAFRHQSQGSGLGLYIAKAIIEKSGGKLGFKSEEGQGSTFWFTLPIK
ncbi:MAG: HAMP domain-containing histidine kinase [Candidatus Nealsonbacteria bacterium]|nr:HAMP domain-containing histidine kinase [Candidatus Nealsonbacteria bacterium]